MAHALASFQDLVQDEMPNIPVFHTEDLSYEGALQHLIANSNSINAGPDALPFFAYKRSVLREIEDKGLGRRAKNCIQNLRVGSEILQYSMAYGEIDIQFLYASNNIELTEKFEVVYNSEEGITGTKELSVDMDALGVFKYYLGYQDLEDMIIEHEETFYKGIIGSITLRGFYFTFRGKAGLIETINQRILSARDLNDLTQSEVLGSITIP